MALQTNVEVFAQKLFTPIAVEINVRQLLEAKLAEKVSGTIGVEHKFVRVFPRVRLAVDLCSMLFGTIALASFLELFYLLHCLQVLRNYVLQARENAPQNFWNCWGESLVLRTRLREIFAL